MKTAFDRMPTDWKVQRIMTSANAQLPPFIGRVIGDPMLLKMSFHQNSTEGKKVVLAFDI